MSTITAATIVSDGQLVMLDVLEGGAMIKVALMLDPETLEPHRVSWSVHVLAPAGVAPASHEVVTVVLPWASPVVVPVVLPGGP